MRLIHNSPGGALEIEGIRGAIEPGVPFEVRDEDAPGLLVQSDLYQIAPAPEEKK